MGPEVLTSWTWMIGVVMFLLFFYIIGTWNYNTFRNRNMRYLAPKMPFAGNLWPIFTGKKSCPELILDLYNHGKCSGYCGMFEFTRPFIMICEPELIKNTVVKHFEIFPGRRVVPFDDLDPIAAKSVFSLVGKRWRKVRQNMSPVFATSNLRTQFELQRKCAQYSCKHLEKKMFQHKLSFPDDHPMEVDFKDFFMKFTLNVIVSVAYGWNINNYEDVNNELMWCANHFVNIFSGNEILVIGGYLLWPELMHKLRIPLFSKKFHDILLHATQRGVAERMTDETTRPDLVQHLLTMKARMEGSNFDDEDLAAQAFSFFVAGFETVSTSLYFATYLLAIHPDHQRRVQQEIDEMFVNTNGELTYENISNLKYLEMVLQETLRMYPPLITTDRVCKRTFSVPVTHNEPPLVINYGEIVVIPIYGLHHDPEYFPEPHNFDPERFNQENIKNIKPNTYLPFGIAGRKCMGDRFAMLELKLLLATLLARFSFSAVSSTPIPMVFKKTNLLLVPEHGYALGVTSREN